MKFKVFCSIAILSSALLPSCTNSDASNSEEPAPENGAGYRKGEGVSLTEEMASSIGLKTSEVTEGKIDSTISISLRNAGVENEVSGWLSSNQSEALKPGAVFQITDSKESTATVLRIEKPAFSTSGDSEIVLRPETAIAPGSTVQAKLKMPSSEDVVAVPKEAVLKTAEGLFVYAKNGKFFVRTPVKTGSSSETHFQILDGLYAGDEIVTSGVNALWMAELQVLRGGKACTCGQ